MSNTGAGVGSPNLPRASLVDEVMGHHVVGGVATTVRITTADLSAQVAEAIAIDRTAPKVYATWAGSGALALAAQTPGAANLGAQIPDTDTGTHVDPVTGLTVANAGFYASAPKVGGGFGYQWIAPTGLAQKAAATALDAETAARIAGDADLSAEVADLDGRASVAEARLSSVEAANGSAFLRLSGAETRLLGVEAATAAAAAEISAARGGEASLDARADAVEARVAAVEAAAALWRAATAAASGLDERPGDAPWCFSADLAGAFDDKVPLDGALVRESADGLVVELQGEATVSPRRVWRLEPGRVFTVTAAVRRAVDPVDPAIDAVELGLVALTSAKALMPIAPVVLVRSENLFAIDGRVLLSATVAGEAGTDIDVVWPAGVVYAAVYVRTFGGTHRTQVETIRVEDTTMLALVAGAL
ncbi:hypothetical protein [Oharaeibacter diazotrophicus]|uniref:Uncharacterized protein n=2 Tax=Oharaeibacter diazotrophicus TaxID=1920512 RepID=A0A4R6RGK1_9HYPH|nr:hypothetical protein [Oharaeibacter diazotrophicus]TDP85402.1 hypothetical protein EDD54_2255 [Oharaeibacter diazotrophicus]BBE74372.1 hypothetical protein OHA_1_04003 [Pleomorphomonas sp. SM30]GLS75935.1 hypothetical protein GCM10007904_12700 [Oharaeibacter diazotrophicus]